MFLPSHVSWRINSTSAWTPRLPQMEKSFRGKADSNWGGVFICGRKLRSLTSITCGATTQEQGRANSLWAPPFSFHNMSCSVGGARTMVTTRSEKSKICSLMSASLSSLFRSTISLRFLFPLFFSKLAEKTKSDDVTGYFHGEGGLPCVRVIGTGSRAKPFSSMVSRVVSPSAEVSTSICRAPGNKQCEHKSCSTKNFEEHSAGALWKMIKDHPVGSGAWGCWAFPSKVLP